MEELYQLTSHEVTPIYDTTTTLRGNKAIHLDPHSETAISLPVPFPLVQGLIETGLDLPDQVMVMDGVTNSFTHPNAHDPVCTVILANFSHLPIRIPANTPLAVLTYDPHLKIKQSSSCLSISDEKPRIVDTAHIEKLDLSHIPSQHKPHYLSLLRSYADVFSKNDLDVGHCKSLPHQVRLKDPNRVTSVNQYRLAHHLKEVAIDYVERLLAAGVVRKSNSVFNSPLMLVKKPHTDPSKPLSEQYRLVHNYVELNKNISPCSYPLRHLYELLDDEIMSYLPFKIEYLNGKDMFVDVLSRPLGYAQNVNTIHVKDSKIPSLLKQAHDKAGHLNSLSTLNTLRQNFTWPTMAKDVQTYVRSCLACQQNNPARPSKVAPLQNLTPLARQFGVRIHLDLVDMPKSNEGHVAICTLVDAATGYTILRPVFDKNK